MALPAAVRSAQPVTAQLDFGLWRSQRVRLVRQTEIAECGLASLAMLARYHGFEADLGALRRRFPPSQRGATLKSLIAIGDQIGLTSRAVKLPLEQLENLRVPAILHWEMNHFVVLERVKRGKALIHNPEGRSKWYGLEELSRSFTGIALEMQPAEEFEPLEKAQRLRLSQLWRRLTGFKRALLQTLVLSLVMQAFVLASPYYMQIALDQALPALDYDLLTVLAIGFGLFTLINTAATLLRSLALLSAGTSLSFGIATNVARRLFRLPVAWFEKRHIGDILSRFWSITPIQQALTQGAVAVLIDGVLATLILLVMFFYSVSLSLIALVALLLYAAVRLVSFSYQWEAQQSVIVDRAKEQSMLIESIRGLVTLRLFNRESARHAGWQARLTDAVNADIGLARINIWQVTANTLIFGLETVVSIWLAVRFTIDGGFSVGMVFALLAYKTQFLTRGASLIDQTIVFKMLALHLDRLSDIALADQDVSFRATTTANQPFGGRVELRNIHFRYSPTEPTILKGVNLCVEPGDNIAITGASGGGKSTLAKILLGLLEPEAGEVLVDGIPLARFGYKQFHEEIAAVLQDDHLFTGSLADNIALFDDSPDRERIEEAARAAAIHDDILAMPMRYETLVGDMGSTLSGGQRQRILLARALYRKPKLLVLDESTSQLDVTHEKAVAEAIRQLDVTRVIIAHRQETIATAEDVYILENGQLRRL